MLKDKVLKTETHVFYRRLGQWWSTAAHENNWSFVTDRSQVTGVEVDEAFEAVVVAAFNRCTSPEVVAYLQDGTLPSTEVVIEGETFKVVFEQVTEEQTVIDNHILGMPIGEIFVTICNDDDVNNCVSILEMGEDVRLHLETEQFRHDAREAIWDARYDR